MLTWLDATGKVLFKTTVNSLTGAYSFTRAEVTRNYTIVLSTTDVAVGATPPSIANLPAGWVSTGDAYGTGNNAGTGIESRHARSGIPVQIGLV